MKTFNEIMKIRDEPDNKPEVTKRKFQVKKTNNEKMQAFGWASVLMNLKVPLTSSLISTGKVERCTKEAGLLI